MSDEKVKVVKVLQCQGAACAKALWWDKSRKPMWLEIMTEDRKTLKKAIRDTAKNVWSEHEYMTLTYKIIVKFNK